MENRKITLTPIAQWMHRNARELELYVWRTLFEGAENSSVADALLYYQNKDGGFGHGIDMDNWNPNSVPYNCLVAIDFLKMVEFYDMTHPVYEGIKNYLNATGPKQWHFVIPSNNDYPHASFHGFEEEYNKVESIGIIIGLSAFVLKYCQDYPVYNEVLNIINEYIEKIQNNKLGDMGPTGYVSLINAMESSGIEGYNYVDLNDRLKVIVNKTIQRDPAQWQHYGYRPSEFIRSKESAFYSGNENIVEKELDFLIETIPENDIWPVSWRWFETSKLYPNEEAISLHISKARKGIEKMLFLKNFGRIEF